MSIGIVGLVVVGAGRRVIVTDKELEVWILGSLRFRAADLTKVRARVMAVAMPIGPTSESLQLFLDSDQRSADYAIPLAPFTVEDGDRLCQLLGAPRR